MINVTVNDEGKAKNREKYPRLMIDDDGMILLRLNKDEDIVLNSGDGPRGDWDAFDTNVVTMDMEARLVDFTGTITLRNEP